MRKIAKFLVFNAIAAVFLAIGWQVASMVWAIDPIVAIANYLIVFSAAVRVVTAGEMKR